MKLLQNRLHAGHNWNVLQDEVAIGISALVAVGTDACSSNTESLRNCSSLTDRCSIEKTQHQAFSAMLDLMEQERGDSLLRTTIAMSDKIYDTLRGRPPAPMPWN